MPLLTTTIGAYPKPDSVAVPDWFGPGSMDTSVATTAYQAAVDRLGDQAEAIFAAGSREVIEDQVGCRHRRADRWRDKARELHPLSLPPPGRLRLRER